MNVNLNSTVPVGDPAAAAAAGTIPHLTDLLWDEYRKHLEAKLATIPEAMRLSLDEALRRAPATSFRDFAVNYLTANRPVGTFALDRNVGLKLRDNRLVAVAVHAAPTGAMAPEGEEARRYEEQLYAEQAVPPPARAMPMSSPSEVDHSGSINVF